MKIKITVVFLFALCCTAIIGCNGEDEDIIFDGDTTESEETLPDGDMENMDGDFDSDIEFEQDGDLDMDLYDSYDAVDTTEFVDDDVIDRIENCGDSDPEPDILPTACVGLADWSACDDENSDTIRDVCLEEICTGVESSLGGLCSSASDCKGESYCAIRSGDTSGRCRARVQLLAPASTAIALDPTGTVVATDVGGLIYIYHVADGRVVRILECNGSIDSLAFTPDGRSLLSGHLDDRAVLWNLGDESATFEISLTSSVEDVAVSPGGTRLAIAHQQGVGVYDASTGGSLVNLYPTRSYALPSAKLRFGSNDDLLFVVGYDSVNGKVDRWDLSQPLVPRRYSSYGLEVFDLWPIGDSYLLLAGVQPSFPLDGDIDGVPSVTEDKGEFIILDLDSGDMVGPTHELPGTVSAIRATADGSRVFVSVSNDLDENPAVQDATGWLYSYTLSANPVQLAESWSVASKREFFDDLVLSPDDQWLVSTGRNGLLQQFSAADGSAMKDINAYFIPNGLRSRGNFVAAAGHQGNWQDIGAYGVWWLDTLSSAYQHRFSYYESRNLRSVAISSDCSKMAISSAIGDVYEMHLPDGPGPYASYFHNGPFVLRFAPDRYLLASAGQDERILFSPFAAPGQPRVVRPHSVPIMTIDITDNLRFASGAYGSSRDTTAEIFVWDLPEEGDPIIVQDLSDGYARVNQVLFSKDGAYLAAGGYSTSMQPQVSVWRTSDWQRLGLLEDNVVAFTPDGEHVITSRLSASETIRIYSLPGLDLVREIEGEFASALEVSDDGRWLIGLAYGRMLRLWDIEDLQSGPN